MTTRSNGPKKGNGCLFKIIILAVVLLIVVGINLIGKLVSFGADKLNDQLNKMSYRFSSNSVETLNEKIRELVAAGDFREAAIYMDENDWYAITDTETVNVIITAVNQNKVNTRDNNTYSSTDYENVEKVVARIQCPDAKDLSACLDKFYAKYGAMYIGTDNQKALDLWKKCTASSYGNSLYKCFHSFEDSKSIGEGYPITGAQMLADYIQTDPSVSFEAMELYRKYINGTAPTTFSEYYSQEACLAIMDGQKHAKNLGTVKFPEADHHQMENNPMTDQMRAALPDLFTSDNDGKVLILNRIQNYETDEFTLETNCIMMRCLPEAYWPESMEDVGYIVLIDYGYIHDGVWYAGTATINVYNVSTEEIIYTSETINADYRTFYYGEPTNYIFSAYPEVSTLLMDAIHAIEEA